jgi:hypothetical protein
MGPKNFKISKFRLCGALGNAPESIKQTKLDRPIKNCVRRRFFRDLKKKVKVLPKRAGKQKFKNSGSVAPSGILRRMTMSTKKINPLGNEDEEDFLVKWQKLTLFGPDFRHERSQRHLVAGFIKACPKEHPCQISIDSDQWFLKNWRFCKIVHADRQTDRRRTTDESR